MLSQARSSSLSRGRAVPFESPFDVAQDRLRERRQDAIFTAIVHGPPRRATMRDEKNLARLCEVAPGDRSNLGLTRGGLLRGVYPFVRIWRIRAGSELFDRLTTGPSKGSR